MSPLPGIYASAESANISVGAYDALASVTLSAATASVSFAGIPTGYKHLQIRAMARDDNAGVGSSDWFSIACNADTTYTNYRSHYIGGVGSGTPSAGTLQASNYYLSSVGSGRNGTAANIFGVAIMDILDYANTNKYKTMRGLGGHDDNGTGEIYFTSSMWMNTSAITSLTITAGSTNNFLIYSTFALYGIK